MEGKGSQEFRFTLGSVAGGARLRQMRSPLWYLLKELGFLRKPGVGLRLEIPLFDPVIWKQDLRVVWS